MSRRGGRAEQTARLLSLHAYLSGDRRTAAPAAVAPPPERAPSGDSEDGAGPLPAAGWVLGGTRAPTAASVSHADTAGRDGPADASHAGVLAAEAMPPAESKPAAAAKPAAAQRHKAAEPVSRWTTVDDADEGDDEPIMARIVAGASRGAGAEQSSDDEDIFKGAAAPVVGDGSAPPLPRDDEAGEDANGMEADRRSAGGATPPAAEREVDPAAVAKAARAAKDDEERRQRLRQVRCNWATASG